MPTEALCNFRPTCAVIPTEVNYLPVSGHPQPFIGQFYRYCLCMSRGAFLKQK